MPSTPEGKVKIKIRLWLKNHMPNHWRVAPRGGPFGKIGCPDELICWMGVFIAIEVKSNTGTPSDAQFAQLQLIKRAGGVASIVYGYDEVKLEKIKQAALDIVNGRLHHS